MDYILECISLYDCIILRYFRFVLVYNVNLVFFENLIVVY